MCALVVRMSLLLARGVVALFLGMVGVLGMVMGVVVVWAPVCLFPAV